MNNYYIGVGAKNEVIPDHLRVCEEQAERALKVYNGEQFDMLAVCEEPTAITFNVPTIINARCVSTVKPFEGEKEMKTIEEKAEGTSILEAIQAAISQIGPKPLSELKQYSAEDLKMMFECAAAKRVEEQKEKLRLENEHRHLNHPFYERADDYREEERRNQILKGAAKYPKPFEPMDWTPKELLQHAMQENIDQAHYIYGLYEHLEEMENEISNLQQENKTLSNYKRWYESQLTAVAKLTDFLEAEFPEAGNAGELSVDIAIDLLKDYKIDHDEYFGQRKAHTELLTEINGLGKYLIVHYPQMLTGGEWATDVAKRVMDAYRKGEEFNAKG